MSDTDETLGGPGSPTDAGLGALVRRLREEYLAKGAKYLAVSAFNVVVGQSLLFGFQALGVAPVTANMAAVAISAVPAYLLSRYWVWQKNDSNQWLKEVLPFWALAFGGFVLSTIAVDRVTAYYDGSPPKLLVNVTNMAAFGTIWVGKFFILDRILFRQREPEDQLIP